MSTPKVGRNDPCPCGSGKKYKRCCLLNEPPPAPAAEAPEALPSPADGDLEDAAVSPAFWRKLAKRLPRHLRKELSPILENAGLFAESDMHSPEIEAAIEALEAHREKYARLAADPQELLRRSEELFMEERFDSMRYHAADVQRAFDAVGHPLPGKLDKRYLDTLEEAIRFLADDAQQVTLANRLLCMLPEFVATGRYVDGWIIQRSAHVMLEPSAGIVGPFLMAMFMRGMDEWERGQAEAHLALLKEFGLDPEQIQGMGYKGVQAWIDDETNRPDAIAAMESFLAKHPELAAALQRQSRVHEQAAIEMLDRGDARVLYLSRDEVAPWLTVLAERLREDPAIPAAMPRSRPPSKAATKAFNHLAYAVACEMTRAIFTPARLMRLTAQIHDYQQQLPEAAQDDVLDGIHGALAAAQIRDVPADKSRFLVVLCGQSLQAAVQAGGPAEQDGAS